MFTLIYVSLDLTHFIPEMPQSFGNPAKLHISKKRNFPHTTGEEHWHLLAESCSLSNSLGIWIFLVFSKNSAVKSYRKKCWHDVFTLPLLHVPSLSYSCHTAGPSGSHNASPCAHFTFNFTGAHQILSKIQSWGNTHPLSCPALSFQIFLPCSYLRWPGTGAELQCW